MKRPDAVIFDLDGVITDTARVHAMAWKALFDDVLRAEADSRGAPFVPFDIERDYHAYVDGRPRYEGVETFLSSRSIRLALGAPDDPPDAPTVCGLGNRKDRIFARVLDEKGVRVFPSSLALVEELTAARVPMAIASSSRNCLAVLRRVGLDPRFCARVDGTVSAQRGLRGKPDPAIFLECARELGVDPRNCVVVEDAIAGVQAGAAGGFGLVLGVDRVGQSEVLRKHGAHVVVPDLEGVGLKELTAWLADEVRR